MINTRLLHYHITAKLGAGGMGEVYRATDTKLGREVAIKVLPSNFGCDPQWLSRFEREAKALAALNHPHIAGIHGFEADQGRHFIVLELVEGETLAERLQRGPLPVKEALLVAHQIAEAIQEAHEKGIIHRDLKPGNVKITPNRRVKVLDFGLAKMEQAIRAGPEGPSGAPATEANTPTMLADVTLPGAVMGTPAYMSPEQARGQEVDKRTDIWAFGCCLFECLSGRKPFCGHTVSDLVAEVLKADPDWSQLPAETPREVVTLLRRCLEKEPSRRLSSIGDIAIMLDESTRGAVAAVTSRQSAEVEGATQSVEPTRAERPMRASPWAWVAVVILVMSGVGWWLTHERGATGPSPPPPRRLTSLAVLPFLNPSRDSEQEFFVDGFTDLLCTELAGVSALKRVISRATAMQFKGTSKKVPEIAAELGVDAVVEGSVQREGNRVVVSVQLIEGATDRHLWATNYEREVSSVLKLKMELARAIAGEVQAKLTPQEETRLASARPVSPQVLEAYLKGRFFWNKRTAEDLKRAIEHFAEAIEKDPEFGLAFAGLASTYVLMPYYAKLPPKVFIPKAREAALKALATDSTLAEAHALLAHIKSWFEWDRKGAGEEFRRVIEQSPNYATAHQWYGLFLSQEGRFDEAMTEIKRAQKVDPLSLVINVNIGDVLYLKGEYDQAIAQYRKTLELDPNFVLSHLRLGEAYIEKKMFSEAISEIQKARTLAANSPYGLSSLGRAYALSGSRIEALKILDELNELAKEGHSLAVDKAIVHNALGDTDNALAWLEKGLEEHMWELLELKVWPIWANVRREPRFIVLLEKIGLQK